MSSATANLAHGRVDPDGHLTVPSDVLLAAGLGPGEEVVFEPAVGGLFVQSRRTAEAEDAADREALADAESDPEGEGRPVAWAEVKRELQL